MNVLGALERPNGMTSHSYSPPFVLNAVFHSSPSLIRIWWYPLLRSILKNTREPWSSSNISSSRGIGCRYLIVILFMARLFTHILQLPSFLGTKRAGTAQGLRLSLTNPLEINSSTCLWISFVSVGFIL